MFWVDKKVQAQPDQGRGFGLSPPREGFNKSLKKKKKKSWTIDTPSSPHKISFLFIFILFLKMSLFVDTLF